jgi:hypothetical protein
MEFEDAYECSEFASRYEYGFRSPPKEISEWGWEWEYALRAAPPEMHCGHRGDGEESFHSPEPIALTIRNIYVRIGKRYFHLRDTTLFSHERRVEKVREAFPELK